MSETKLPGVKARHAIITQSCRARGVDEMKRDVLERVDVTLDDILNDPRCASAVVHIAVTIEYPEPG